MSDEHQPSTDHLQEPAGSGGGHAHGDPDPEINPRSLAWVPVLIAVVVLFSAGLLWLVVDDLSDRRDVRDQGVERVDPSRPQGPLLQAAPPLDLEALRHWEEETLTSYGWVDRSAGTARVPVEKAREMVLEHGLPQPRAGEEVTP